MAEQQPGLRFDIYERVHLQEQLADIHELNDVELVPHIQVLTLNDQAILKGNLLLTGSYASEHGEESRTLEHLIPVEITLPLNRIHRVEDILVEIENFDVDLLSARSLNVTGVLSLQGVEMVSAPLGSWADEEEMTFVHEAETYRNEVVPPPAEPAPQPVVEPPAAEAPVETILAPPAPEPAPQQPVYEAPPAAPVPIPQEQPPVSAEPLHDTEIVGVEAIQELTELKVTPHQDSTVVTEEKKELKVAFGKKANEAVEIQPYGIKSLLSKAGSLFQQDKREADAKAGQAEETKIDAVEWKRLFINTDSGAQEFRKLRMCIVQREETLESIAKRYQLNPRELQLFNRLGEQELTAGQVIYLP